MGAVALATDLPDVDAPLIGLLIASLSFAPRPSGEERGAARPRQCDDAPVPHELSRIWPGGVFRADAAGQNVSANEAWCEFHGMSADRAVGRGWELSIHPDDRERVVHEWYAAVAKGCAYASEHRYLLPDGDERWGFVQCFPEYDEQHQAIGYIGVIADITERKRAVAALHEREGQVIAAQRQEAIGRLAGGLAHDFNNLLTAIVGYSEILLHELATNQPLREDAVEIHRAAGRAAGLTHQLLAYSRRQVLNPRPVDLNQTVREMQRMLHRLVGEDVRQVMMLAPALPLVAVDPAQIEQVIMNLVVNARDAMLGGGCLTIATQAQDVDEARAASVVGLVPGRYVTLSVQDSGCGMDAATQARIFEPFFTTKPAGEGTGLGLSSVYGVVMQSGGAIAVESELGVGTQFQVFLPQAQADDEEEAPPAASAGEVSGSETILLAEDDGGVRKLVARVLTTHGYRVLAVASGEEALRIAEAHEGKIDLLLSDVVMPDLGGPELVRRLRQAHPHVAVLLVSGYAYEGVAALEGRDRPRFLAKPFTPEGLALQVREALDARERRTRSRND